MSVTIKLLERYRVDREAGVTLDGSTQLVVLVLKGRGISDVAFAISKADAMVIASMLAQAATEASDHMARD